MNDFELKIVRGKASYGGNPSIRNVKEVLSLNAESKKCK